MGGDDDSTLGTHVAKNGTVSASKGCLDSNTTTGLEISPQNVSLNSTN
jgi:hypothetical protein